MTILDTKFVMFVLTTFQHVAHYHLLNVCNCFAHTDEWVSTLQSITDRNGIDPICKIIQSSLTVILAISLAIGGIVVRPVTSIPATVQHKMIKIAIGPP